MPSAEGALRIAKSLEVLSVSDESSGNSPKTITQESQHARQDNSRRARMGWRANITISSSNRIRDLYICVSQRVQGIFHSAPRHVSYRCGKVTCRGKTESASC